MIILNDFFAAENSEKHREEIILCIFTKKPLKDQLGNNVLFFVALFNSGGRVIVMEMGDRI